MASERVHQFSRDGLTFQVRDEGPVDADRTVLLLHGFPQTPSAFDGVAPALHEAGLRTLAPAQRGYSPGARPTARSAYRIGAIADDAVALLDAAGVDQAHVLGHDWGGMAAWALAGLHPERVASLTVLSTPHPAALGWSFTHSSQGLRSWYMGFFQLPWLPERLIAGRMERPAALERRPSSGGCGVRRGARRAGSVGRRPRLVPRPAGLPRRTTSAGSGCPRPTCGAGTTSRSVGRRRRRPAAT